MLLLSLSSISQIFTIVSFCYISFIVIVTSILLLLLFGLEHGVVTSSMGGRSGKLLLLL